jgi:anti-anti-sigma factor
MAAARLLIHTMRDVTIVNFEESSILDTMQIEAIGKTLYELVDVRNCKKLILDFTKVHYLSSSALGVLITLRTKSSAIKGTLVICGLRKELMKVFEITNLKKMFTFCPGETEALATFGVTTAG